MKTLRFNIIRKLNEQKQRKIYSELNKNHKQGHEAVGWLSKERQRLRYDKLTNRLDLKNKKILDFGCGLGAFCGYLKDIHAGCEYTGIDLVEGYIKKAKAEHSDATFKISSILDVEDRFDYVFSSGTYAFCTKELFFEYVQKSIEISKIGYHFNMLFDAKSSGYFRFSKDELVRFLNKLGYKYSLEYGYLDNDATILIQK